MARPKTPTKKKEPIRLRLKDISNSCKSFYLDIYTNGNRKYEFLKIYLIPERTPIDKESNRQAWKQAEAIQAQRLLDYNNGKAGIKTDNRIKMLLSDYMAIFYDEQKRLHKKWLSQCKSATERLRLFDSTATLKDVTPDFCRDFIDYLVNEYVFGKKEKKHLTNYTIKNTLAVLSCAMNMAVRDGIITTNPLTQLSSTEIPQKPESNRVYLTIEELKKLEATECGNPYVKQAYLFSCYCGLRISDVQRLQWCNITETGERLRLEIVQKKTGRAVYLPLSNKAVSYLPDRGTDSDTDNVFKNLPNVSNVDKGLRNWAKRAGITKKVTFHTARHTFATTLLTLGADLYTTSKLMGHSEVRTTQIYAKIVDEAKSKAVDLLDNI